MNFKERLFGQKDILSIGFANLFGSGITAIFWFYIASLLGPAEYYAEIGRLNTNLTIIAAGTVLMAVVLLITSILLYSLVSVVREKN